MKIPFSEPNNIDDSFREEKMQRTSEFLTTVFGEQSLDSTKMTDWFLQTEFSHQDFIDFLVRVHGLVRNLPMPERALHDGDSNLGGSKGDYAMISPKPADREKLLEQMLQLTRTDSVRMDPDQSTIIGRTLLNGIHRIHPFIDGNGRTGRLAYHLLTHPQYATNEEATETTAKQVLDSKRPLYRYHHVMDNHFYGQELEKRGLEPTFNDNRWYHARLSQGKTWGFDPNCLGYLALHDILTPEERIKFGKHDPGTEVPWYDFKYMPSDIKDKYSAKIWETRKEFTQTIIEASADDEKWPTKLQHLLDESFYPTEEITEYVPPAAS